MFARVKTDRIYKMAGCLLERKERDQKTHSNSLCGTSDRGCNGTGRVNTVRSS